MPKMDYKFFACQQSRQRFVAQNSTSEALATGLVDLRVSMSDAAILVRNGVITNDQGVFSFHSML